MFHHNRNSRRNFLSASTSGLAAGLAYLMGGQTIAAATTIKHDPLLWPNWSDMEYEFYWEVPYRGQKIPFGVNESFWNREAGHLRIIERCEVAFMREYVTFDGNGNPARFWEIYGVQNRYRFRIKYHNKPVFGIPRIDFHEIMAGGRPVNKDMSYPPYRDLPYAPAVKMGELPVILPG